MSDFNTSVSSNIYEDKKPYNTDTVSHRGISFRVSRGGKSLFPLDNFVFLKTFLIP